MSANARSDTLKAQQGNQLIRGLQRDYEASAALDQQLNLRLQEVRLDVAKRGNVSGLSFRVVETPLLPRHPDGILAWEYVLMALSAGVLAAIFYVLVGVLADDKLRESEQIVSGVEIPVLAVIPELRITQYAGDVRWGVVTLVLLVMVTAAACVSFMVLFG